MPKSLAKQTADLKTIDFQFKGKNYSEEIDENFKLSNYSMVELKDMLNELPGRFAYWKTVASQVELELEDLQEQYDLWFAEKYMEEDSIAPSKATEGYKKNSVMLNNVVEFKTWGAKLRSMKEVLGKVTAIVKALDMQQWTLRAIADLTRMELANLEPTAKGKRSLKEDE